MYASEKYIVSISYFLEHYFQIVDTENRKFTHDFMREFLIEKKGRCAKRVAIASIDKESILKGQIVYVKDVEGKIIPYRAPILSLNSLEKELKMNCDRERLMEIREEILRKQVTCQKQKSYDKKRRDENGQF